MNWLDGLGWFEGMSSFKSKMMDFDGFQRAYEHLSIGKCFDDWESS